MSLFSQQHGVIIRIISANCDLGVIQVADGKSIFEMRVGFIQEDNSGVLAWREMEEPGSFVCDDEQPVVIAWRDVVRFVVLIQVIDVQWPTSTIALST